MTTPHSSTPASTPHHTTTKTASQTFKDVTASIPSPDQLEDKMDAVADQLTHQIEGVVSPELTAKTSHIFGTFDRLLDQIESIISDLVGLIPVVGNTSSNDATLTIAHQETVSRLFIFRRLRLIIQYPIVAVWSMWAGILFLIQFLHMLLLGKRNAGLHKRLVRFVTHTTKRSSYITTMSDTRPALFVK